MILLMGFFFIIPLIRIVFPRTNAYLGFLPAFFFIPFFWSFGGRRRFIRSQKMQNRTAAEESQPSGTSTVASTGPDPEFSMLSQSSTPWNYMKYIAIAFVIAFGIILYFVLT